MQNPLQASAYTTPLVLTQTFIFLISFIPYILKITTVRWFVLSSLDI